MKKYGLFTRRNFIKTTAAGIAGIGAAGSGRLTGGEESPAPSPTVIKKYNILGRTGFKASEIGMGTSRGYTIPVLNALLDAGVNYIDTAESYGRGKSETNLGKAIAGRDRKSLFITTKLHLKEDAGEEEIVKRFEKCLNRLNTPYIDCLMMHNAKSAASLKSGAFHSAVKKLKKQGKLRFTGVSSHGDRSERGDDVMREVMMGAIKDGRFDVLLVVYNFMKTDPGEKILRAAKKKNIGVTIMKSNPVNRYYTALERVEKLKAEGKAPGERLKNYLERMQSTAEQSEAYMKKHNLQNYGELRDAALKFILENRNADVLNLAFHSFDDVERMLRLSGHDLAASDKQKLERYAAGAGAFYCRHACGICESACPEKVPVNTIMRYNHYFENGGSEKYAMEKYAGLDAEKPDACNQCDGACESACPYGLPVKGLLELAHMNLTLS